MIYEASLSEVIHQTLRQCLDPLGRSALVLPNGTAILVHSSVAADIATLPHVAGLCHRYLNLGEGGLAIANDPNSGGTHLSEFTLVRGVRLSKLGGSGWLLAKRIAFPLHLPLSGSLAQEGVRVPPTPLASAGVINQDLLSAIAAHPLSPLNFAEVITRAAAELESTAEHLQALGNDPNSILGEKKINAYLADSKRAFESFMSRLPLGAAIVTLQRPNGETLKLQLRISEERVFFDFGGSDPALDFGMSDLATFGACWSTLVGSFSANLPLNDGSFQHVQVSAPSKTLLSASASTGTVRGMSEGIALVTQAVHSALTRLRPGMATARSWRGQSRYQLHFSAAHGHERKIEIPLASGSGASEEGVGSDVSSNPSQGEPPPLWKILLDLRDPGLELLSVGLRKPSGGDGKHRGGRGLRIHIRINQSCTLRWHDPALSERFDGINGGRAGLSAALEIKRALENESSSVASDFGETKLVDGDEVIFLSAGGGGQGETATVDPCG